MKPEINLPWVYSGKFHLGKLSFSRAKVRSVTSIIVSSSCQNFFINAHRESLKEGSFVERNPDLKLNLYLLKTLSQLKLQGSHAP